MTIDRNTLPGYPAEWPDPETKFGDQNFTYYHLYLSKQGAEAFLKLNGPKDEPLDEPNQPVIEPEAPKPTARITLCTKEILDIEITMPEAKMVDVWIRADVDTGLAIASHTKSCSGFWNPDNRFPYLSGVSFSKLGLRIVRGEVDLTKLAGTKVFVLLGYGMDVEDAEEILAGVVPQL